MLSLTGESESPSRVLRAIDHLRLEKSRDLADEVVVILIQRSVSGIGIDDQFRVRQMLRKDVGIDRFDQDVVAAVDDERGLLDVRESCVSVTFRHLAPSSKRRALILRRLRVIGGSRSAVRSAMRATYARAAVWLFSD